MPADINVYDRAGQWYHRTFEDGEKGPFANENAARTAFLRWRDFAQLHPEVRRVLTVMRNQIEQLQSRVTALENAP